MGGGQKLRLIVQQLAKIQKALINIPASKYFSESCHIYLITICVTQQKYKLFVDFSYKN